MDGPNQFSTWRVCQFCGRVTAADDAQWWLVSQHRYKPHLTIVRCPEHWSEWALRHCVDGRTKQMRQRAREAKSQPAPPIPPELSPFPMQERTVIQDWEALINRKDADVEQTGP